MKRPPIVVPAWPGVVLALFLVAAAAFLRASMPSLLSSVTFLPFFPAVIASALLAGPAAGVLATLASATVVLIWFKPPRGPDAAEAAAVAVPMFVGIGLMTVWLADRVRQGRDARSAGDEARLRLATIVESSDDAIVSKGLDGVIRSWNDSAARLFGYTADEIVGRSIVLLVPPDLIGEQRAVIDHLRRGERVEPFETIRLHKAGTPVRVLATISPLRGPGGTVVGAVEITRDMSPRLRIEADLRRANTLTGQTVAQLRAVIDGMSEGVVVADADGNLIEWNRPALHTHGYASLDEVRQHLSTFADRFDLIDDGRSLPLDEWPMSRVLRGEGFSDTELVVRRRDRPLEVIVNYSGRPVTDSTGRVELAILTLHDVTEERRAQQAVRDHAERLSLALEAAGLGDWSWDAVTDDVVLSPTATAIFGIGPDMPPKREAMRTLIHEADRDRAREASTHAMKVRGDYDIEYRVPRGNQTIWVAARGRCQYDAQGRVKRMLGVVQDITARKRAEEALRDSREWLELAVAIAQMGTFQIQFRDDRLVLNDAGRAIYGFGPDELVSTADIRACIYPDDAAEVERRLEISIDPDGPRVLEVEHRVVRSDGVVRWVRGRGRTLFDPTPAGPVAVRCVGTFIDVTEQKEAEQRREQLLVAEQAARQQAEHANRMKDEFLATLSHELRTPLNAILGWAEILAAGGTPDDVEQGIEVIRRNARSQAQIIEDLLDMSRIISGKVRLDVKPLDLETLAETAIDTVRPGANAKGVRLHLDSRHADGPVMGDAGRVQQVLWNLLTNAIKFTPNGGDVRLTVSDAADCREAGRCVELQVTDTGEGIPAAFLPYVFDRFRQADASITRRHGGLGLGLAIVKHLTESHGGTVRVDSAGHGHGATFTVSLPVGGLPTTQQASRPRPADDAEAPQAVTASVAGLRVLVVDDEPDARGLVKRLLEDRDAVVMTAGSAAEAMAALGGDGRPDVLISDIGMPGEDGYALIARVRAAGLVLPAVALTAYAREEDRARAVAAGFQSHLAKPVNPGALVTTIARVAGR